MKKNLFSLVIFFIFNSTFAQREVANTTPNATTSDSATLTSKCYTSIEKIDFVFNGTSDLAAIINDVTSGIQVTDIGTPGATGNFLIRGFHSTDGNNAPLIVVNGFPYYSDLNTINNLDIESISVLKSGNALLKYGFRGSNGVIEINTKQGKLIKGPLKITIDANVGINNRAFPTHSVLKDEKDYYETSWDLFRNYYYSNSFNLIDAAQSASDNLIRFLGGYNSYNVPDSQLINPLTGKLNPNAKLKYQSDNWEKEFQRTALRHEYNISALKNGDKGSILFSVGYLNEQGYMKATDFERFTTRLNGQLKVTKSLKVGINASFAHIDKHIPNLNTIYGNPNYISQKMAPIYPYFFRNEAGDKVIDTQTGSYKYDIGDNGSRAFAKGIDVLSYLNMERKENKNNNTAWNINPYLELRFLKDFSFLSKFEVNKNSLSLNSYDGFVYRNFTDIDQIDYSLNQQLLWNRKINLHNLSAAFNYEKCNSKQEGHDWGVYELDGTKTSNHIYGFQTKINSFLGELNYNYDYKYYISGGLRKERNEYKDKFTIWTVGAAWDIAQTKLFKANFSTTKLKLWGEYGYGSINYKVLYNLWNLDNLNAIPKTLDLGLDFSLLKNRIKGSFQIYNRQAKTSYLMPYAPSTGIGISYEAIDFNTQGAELALSIIPIKTKAMFWDLGINLGHYKTKVRNLNGIDAYYANSHGLFVGKPLNSIYAYKSEGVNYATGEELFAAVINGKETTTTDIQIATPSFQGSLEPDLYGGISNRFIYKNWDFSFKLTFSLGGKYYDQVYQDLMGNNLGENWSPDILNRWTIEKPNSTIPKLDLNYGSIKSSRFITSASWLKVSDVTLAYTFNKTKLAQMKLDKLSIYIAAHNLWMLSARKGLNPQLSFYNTNPFDYAPMRTILFGLRLGL